MGRWRHRDARRKRADKALDKALNMNRASYAERTRAQMTFSWHVTGEHPVPYSTGIRLALEDLRLRREALAPPLRRGDSGLTDTSPDQQ